MTLKELLEAIANTKPIENIEAILGKDLGGKINDLRKMAESADRELDLLHGCITELYNHDANVSLIRECLDKITKTK